MSPALVVVGAGPAGLAAAQTLAAAGPRVTLVDEGALPGGQIYRQPPAEIRRDPRAIYGFEHRKAARLHGVVARHCSAIDYRPSTAVWGVSPGHLETTGLRGSERIAFDRLIVATGAMDRVIPFPGWTVPGVFTLGGAQVFLKSQAVGIGERPVLLGTGPLLYLTAYQYLRAGIRPAAVLDTSSLSGGVRALPGLVRGGKTFAKGVLYVGRLRLAGIPIHRGVRGFTAEANADGSVGGLSFTDANGGRRIACDAVAVGFGLRSETQLADLLGLPFAYDARQRQWLPERDVQGRTGVAGVYLAGDGARIGGADLAEVAGELAARALLADIGLPDQAPRIDRLVRTVRASEPFRAALDEVAFPFPHALAASVADEVVVCRCEAISAGEIRRAAMQLGAGELNRAKAFSRVGMGRCQGRICGAAAAEILAATLAVPVERVGRLRGQAPVKPVSLAALAEAAP